MTEMRAAFAAHHWRFYKLIPVVHISTESSFADRPTKTLRTLACRMLEQIPGSSEGVVDQTHVDGVH